LLIVIAVAAAAYGQEAARGQLAWEIRRLVGPDGAKALQDVIHNAYKPAPGLIAGVLGILTAIVGSTSVVVELRDALNTIWHVPPAANSRGFAGLMQLVKDRFYSFALILGGGILLLISVGLNATVAAVSKFFSPFLPASPFMLQIGASVMSFLVVAFLFAAIYKFLPDVSLCWSDVILGAFETAFLFEIGKVLIGLYLGRSTFSSAYGAAGSLVVLLVWVYYSAQVFFLGAEFTKAHTRARIVTGKRSHRLFSVYGELSVARLWQRSCQLLSGGNSMNWDQIEGQWKQAKGKMKEQWGKLTDSDWDVIAGKRDQLLGKLQERYGYTREQAERELADWERKQSGVHRAA